MTPVTAGLLIIASIVLVTALAVRGEQRRYERLRREDEARKRLTRTLNLRQAGAAVRYSAGMDAPYDQRKPVDAARRADAEERRRRELAAKRAGHQDPATERVVRIGQK